jgi:CDP-paratose 2-epimerase
VADYVRSFGIRAVVFRMSCIYGVHQFGNEDQGWIAHFLIRALQDQPITLYGDGMQVRDILFIDDLVDAFLAARERIGMLSGHAFNMGGGPANTVSLRELIELIGELRGRPVKLAFADWRTGDQRYYVSDTGKFRDATGWAPKVGVREGLDGLWRWLQENQLPLRVNGAGRRNPVAWPPEREASALLVRVSRDKQEAP